MKKGTKRLIGLLVFLAIATAAAIFIIQNEGQGSKQAAVKPTEAAENSVANEQEAPEQAFLVYENAEVNCIIDVADSGSVALATGADHISYEVIDGDMPKGLTIAEDGTILGAYPRPMKGRVVTVRASAEGCDWSGPSWHLQVSPWRMPKQASNMRLPLPTYQTRQRKSPLSWQRALCFLRG